MTHILAIILGATLLAGACPEPQKPDPFSLNLPGGFNLTADTSFERGYYVPKDVNDAFAELDKTFSDCAKEWLRAWVEEDMISFHLTIGMFIRNNWIRGRESRLRDYFNGLGIGHPDDMSGIIFTSYWRHLTGKPIDLEGQVAYYKGFWAEVEKSEAEKEAEKGEAEKGTF